MFMLFFFFFFKQKTAYEMRISDWSSDVCSSDLAFTKIPRRLRLEALFQEELVWIAAAGSPLAGRRLRQADLTGQPRVLIAAGKSFEALRLLTSEGGLERRDRKSTRLNSSH